MVTVLREDGFEIVIYTNDHPPPHVHVFLDRGEARIEIASRNGASKVLSAYKMSDIDVRRARRLVERYQGDLLIEWRRIHG